MPRPPFDPDRASGAPPAREYANIAEADVLTVSELASVIKGTLEQRIAAPLRVVGEISNLSARNHWYFSLKDDTSVIGCVAWASTARRLGFEPSDGQEVVATGHVSFYGPQGRTQLYVSDLKPVGAGELEMRFRALCEELRGLGYFDAARKRPLPLLPRRIAVITSADGAALHDVRSTIERRCPSVRIDVVDVRVQGDGAAADGVARAVQWVNEQGLVDAIMVTRGGGSIEDLWAFNERVVADAVLASTLPVIAAIGHESDTTIIELVADVRAATPTQAAMLAVPDAAELHRQITHLQQRLDTLVRRGLAEARHRVTAAARHELFRPVKLLERAAERTTHLERLLGQAVRHRLAAPRTRIVGLGERMHRASLAAVQRRRATVDAMEQRLAALDARQVLRRGFSCTTDEQDRLVRSVDDVRRGQAIVTHVSDGQFRSVVGDTGEEPPAPQMDLFGTPT